MYFFPKLIGVLKRLENNARAYESDNSSAPADFGVGRAGRPMKVVHPNLADGVSVLKRREIHFNINDPLREVGEKFHGIHDFSAV